MVSTFGSLATAYSGLSAARAGLDVTGQNIANAGTTGYTRQRIDQSSVSAPAQAGLLWSTTVQAGQGVSVDGIARLANMTVDAQVRNTAASSAYADARSSALSKLETGLNEPGSDGLSTQLSSLWSSWSDLGNSPDQSAPASVVLSNAQTVANTLRTGSVAIDQQWTDVRSTVSTQVDQLNQAAQQVADLNAKIRTTLQSGGNASDLQDQRDQLTEKIAGLAGGTVRANTDGTVDVVVDGNALVSGTSARTISVSGASRLSDAGTSPVTLSWATGSGSAVSLDSGSIAGNLSLLGAANANGTGGALAEASASYDRIATSLAAQVNAIHEQGTTPTGASGTDFFSFTAGVPAAQGLTVVPTDASGIATRAANGTDYDGSVADRISKLGTGNGSVNAQWSTVVTGIGTASSAASTQSTLTALTASSAKTQQASGAGVDLDEENVNLLQYQHAYQGAARVLTAVDQMLDTLINNTGIVGRA
jgi:flagellar hook-associated protein 1